MDNLSNRVALVTGASSGMGERFAHVLNDAGATVVLTARRADRLAEVAQTLENPLWLAGDIKSPEHRAALMELVRERYGRLDILVNNAGIADWGPLETQSLDQLVAVVDVNLVSVLDLCRLAAELLFAAERASVINVASMYGVVGSLTPMPAYNATKGAIVNFTRHLAAQWGPRGVRVNAICPGYFPTEMTGPIDGRFGDFVVRNTLLRRVPAISELDGPLLFLAGESSSYVTGHTLMVDGGWTAV